MAGFGGSNRSMNDLHSWSLVLTCWCSPCVVRMSWTRYLLHDFWTAREFNKLDATRLSQRKSARRIRRDTVAKNQELTSRIDELEQDLGEAALLLRTLTDLCIEKGVISAEEMMAKAEQLDALDGVIDGRMSKPVDPDMPAD